MQVKTQISIAFLLCFCIFHAIGQSPVALEVDWAKSQGDFTPVSPFTLSDQSDRELPFSKELASFTLLTLNLGELPNFVNSASDKIELSIPGSGQDIFKFELVECEILHPEFKLTTSESNGQSIEYTQGRFYRGTIQGDPHSVAAFSFFDDQVMGVFATQNGGNYVVGAIEDGNEEESTYILYSSNDLKTVSPIDCHTSDEGVEIPDYFNEAQALSGEPCKNVAVYIEADNIMYNDYNRSTNAVNNYINGLYNVVTMLYFNEDITTSIKEILIWTTNDPYRTSDSQVCLSDFTSRMNSRGFNGDLAHLFTTARTNIGGRAYVNILCNNRNKCAISNISRSYRQLPTYSWSVEVVTHEMGHNLGSPHTHNCSWGQFRNRALDNCRPPEGGCSPGPTPQNGGTIMSYCHLTGHGINFNNGFGEEPGNLIRSRVQSASCLGSAFNATVSVTGDETFVEGDSAILKASPFGPAYDHQWFRNGVLIPGATSRELVVKEPGAYYCEIMTNCSEFSEEINIEVIPFVVSVNCPLLPAVEGSASEKKDSMLVSNQEMTHTITVSSDLYLSAPVNAIEQYIELELCMGEIWPATFLNEINVNITSPPAIGFDNEEFVEHKTSSENRECFSINLGDVDPSGEWEFIVSDVKSPNPIGPDAYVVPTFKQVWKLKDRPSDCIQYLCRGGEIELDAGFEDMEYLWSTGETTQKITVDEEGNYAVTVTNGLLVSMDDIDVMFQPSSFTHDVEICEGETYVLGSQVLATSGEYYEEMTSSIGCDSNVTLNLTVHPVKNTSQDVFVCYGEVWNGKMYIRDEMRVFNEQTTKGCDSTHTLTVTVNPELNLTLSTEIACDNIGGKVFTEPEGGSGNGYTYRWSNGATTDSLIGVKKDLYVCTVTDSKGCERIKQIQLENYDSVGATAEISELACPGDSNATIKLNITSATGTIDFDWSTGKKTKDVKNLKAGVYTVVITDGNNCTFEGSYEVIDPDSIKGNPTISNANMGDNGRIVLDPINGLPPYQYLWSTGSMSNEISGLEPGMYTVKITDSNDCMVEEEYEVQNSTGLLNLDQLIGYNIYPNPANTTLQVDLDFAQNNVIQLEIIHVNGAMTGKQIVLNGSTIRETISVDHLTPGSYYLKILSGNDVGIVKFNVLR